MFTEKEIIAAAKEEYDGPICVDMIEDAMKAETLEEAVQIIVSDTYYWDEYWHNLEYLEQMRF